MSKSYRPYEPGQLLLMPPTLNEWLPEGHLAYFVSDVVEALDLRAILSVYEAEERGYPPYHPVMMTKVMVYGYCIGVASSRKIERRLIEDVAFRSSRLKMASVSSFWSAMTFLISSMCIGMATAYYYRIYVITDNIFSTILPGCRSRPTSKVSRLAFPAGSMRLGVAYGPGMPSG